MPVQKCTGDPPLRLLSLDGGGVRGYSMLMLLQEVMLKTFVEIHGRPPKRHEIPRPCDHFDMIGGTGTGGICAILLGRLRLDVETALEIYVEMTKKIFVTDKTIAGIPYGKTIYKSSKLEEAFKIACARHENDEIEDRRLLRRMYSSSDRSGSNSAAASISRGVQGNGSSLGSGGSARHRKSFDAATLTGHSTFSGDSEYSVMTDKEKEDAMLYDPREGRCKTFVTAILKGAPEDAPPQLLRSYDSAQEVSPPCKIWEAGRATSATFPAFKPIQIGQVIFCDEGPGKFNPIRTVVEEAQNEWPGREIGVVVSIGTGKLPPSVTTSENSSAMKKAFVSATPMAKFASARDQHINKINDCERTHQSFQQEVYHMNNIRPDGYFRLNVEMGVGEFGMSEYLRLAEISTNTRAYLSSKKIQAANTECAQKLAYIHALRRRSTEPLPSPPIPEKSEYRPLATSLSMSSLQSALHGSGYSSGYPRSTTRTNTMSPPPLSPGTTLSSPRTSNATTAPSMSSSYFHPLANQPYTYGSAHPRHNTAPVNAKPVAPPDPSDMWDSEGEDEDIRRHIAGLKKIANSIEEERGGGSRAGRRRYEEGVGVGVGMGMGGGRSPVSDYEPVGGYTRSDSPVLAHHPPSVQRNPSRADVTKERQDGVGRLAGGRQARGGYVQQGYGGGSGRGREGEGYGTPAGEVRGEQMWPWI